MPIEVQDASWVEVADPWWSDALRRTQPYFPTIITTGELIILWGLVWFFQIEATRGFVEFFAIAAIAVVINACLPARVRPYWAIVATVAAVWVLQGLEAVAWLIGLGATMFGLCHLPGPVWCRGGALVAAGAVFALLRSGQIPSLVPESVWPLLASLFMLRAIVYVYETSAERHSVPLAQRLSYFFLLPNVCFPVFPIVDWTTYWRSYSATPTVETLRHGTWWILQGIIHLVIYQVIADYGTIEAASIRDIRTLGRFLVSNYLLYLWVSGRFHIAIGILMLLGYRLPRTNNFYFLASSFNDFWNRINIYWKNFMLKLFYYPAVLRLQRRGLPLAIALATAWVFGWTWILHVYQRFWISGRITAPVPEALFYGVLGGCVLLNSLWRYGSRPVKESRVGLGLKTAAMLVTMTAVWTLNTSPNVGELRTIWASAAAATTAAHAIWIVPIFVVLAGGAAVAHAVVSRSGEFAARRPVWATAALASVVWLTGFILETAGVIALR